MSIEINHDIIDNEELLLRKHDLSVRDTIIAHNMKLVKKIANNFDPLDEDVFSEGVIGLIKAIDRYDPSHGTKFSTYAYIYIRGTILDYYNRINYTHPNTFSLNTFINDIEDGTLEYNDCMPDERDFEQEIMDNDMERYRKEFIDNVLSKICNERDKEVYKMYLQGKSKHEITDVHHISRERIRQIIVTADTVINAYVKRFYDKSLNNY